MQTQHNRVSLAGIVGAVQKVQINGTAVIRFTLATTRAYKAKDGSPVLETTWTNCVKYGNCPENIEKGSRVSVTGRLRYQSFTASDGSTRTSYDVVANRIALIPADGPFTFETDTTENTEGWDFRYDEEYPDTAGRNFAGVLTDGNRFLFWHAFADNEGETERCHIYGSLRDLAEHENEICSYPWTADNDALVTEALNGLEDENDWCGEHCPLRTLAFSDAKED